MWHEHLSIDMNVAWIFVVDMNVAWVIKSLHEYGMKNLSWHENDMNFGIPAWMWHEKIGLGMKAAWIFGLGLSYFKVFCIGAQFAHVKNVEDGAEFESVVDQSGKILSFGSWFFVGEWFLESSENLFCNFKISDGCFLGACMRCL